MSKPKNIDPNEPIAIVGIGSVLPGAANTSAFWENVVNKVDSIIEVPKDRWDWKLYYSEDRKAEDKTYSKIGGFVTDFSFEPLKLRIPPPVAKQMDTVQQLAVTATAEALKDAGYDGKGVDHSRTAVIFGNAMGGPKKEASDLRVYTAMYLDELRKSKSFKKLPKAQQDAVAVEVEGAVKASLMGINEDTMPGELSNVIAGRVANTFNLNGTNFTVDAACAASLGAIAQAVNGLRFRQFDMVVTGGVDQMMAAPAYVKFSKIGALSADGSRPFDAKADGFVMGEGCGIVIMKRLSDALNDGDKVYCLLRGIGASSDGRGKGITAPNPKGQKLAIQRAFEGLNYGPGDVGLLEAHGTSTKVGDAVEVQCATELFAEAKTRSIALGSVKSQIGHLKAAAGAAGLIKAALALHHKTLPPSINFEDPNPTVDWNTSPFFVNTEAKPWDGGRIRRANVSAFGFGGTNFHAALEEFSEETKSWTPALAQASEALLEQVDAPDLPESLGAEAFTFSGPDETSVLNSAKKYDAPKSGPLTEAAAKLNNAEQGEYRMTIAAESAEKLSQKIAFALEKATDGAWEKPPIPFKPKSIHLGRKRKKNPKVAFVFPGQGSQYVDMLKDLRSKYKVVAETFEEADRIMTKIIGEGITDILFTKGGESEARLKEMQERIKQTEITQPAVLTADVAILRLLRQYGLEPDVVAGHSLGEYGALVAADVLSFEDALLAVSARGKEMADVDVPDNGRMASIAAPVEKVETILESIDGYVIAANKNCPIQTVIAGASEAVEEAIKRFQAEGVQAVPIEVSHAFHSEIIAPGAVPYEKFLKRIKPRAPKIPVSSNVTAEYYPSDPDEVRKLMVKQISSSVEWIRQVERMYEDGVRLFLECGPKRALTAFITATLEKKKGVVVCSSNHPKKGGVHEFNDMLAKLTAAGIEVDYSVTKLDSPNCVYTDGYKAWLKKQTAPAPAAPVRTSAPVRTEVSSNVQDVLDKWDLYLGDVVVSGLGAGAPGSWDRVFRENAMDDIIDGKNLIEPVSEKTRHEIVEKNLEKVNKSDTGNHTITRLESIEEVLRLAGQAGAFDMSEEFGVRGSISSLMDVTARMGLAASILALKDAGIPLVRHYKKATTGKMIPTSWGLPKPLQEETGVIMASAFPGLDSLVEDMSQYFADKFAVKPEAEVFKLYDKLISTLKDEDDRKAVADWYADYKAKHPATGSKEDAYKFSRSFLFRILSLGHAQSAQFLGAMGPCTQVNAACASTTQAVGIAEDWIRTGRCKRVIVMSCDDITNPTLMPWLGTGFLASGAASTHNVVSEAALPFDRRRSGMIVGMGASALVVENGVEADKRGVTPLAQLLAAQFDNSAYHVTRLNTRHVCETMEKLMRKVEKRYGYDRKTVAGKTLFMSHETYTPAQGGSSAAEVEALKATFRENVGDVIVTNTKGFTGHSMGASLEDVIAVRAMNVGKLPPIANYKEPDPELAGITLSTGGAYDCEFALRLGAGFGSQIAMTFMRRLWHVSQPRVPNQGVYDGWLKAVSGLDAPELETVKNTLRIKDAGRDAARAAMERTSKPATAEQSPKGVAPKFATPVNGAKPETPAAASPTPAAASLDETTVTKEILTLVSDKVGYPEDMLELDLDMEADLGIDTVKQAELIGIIRDKYSIPKNENLSLKDYPTLRHVIKFVMDGGTAGAVATATAETPAAASTPRPESVTTAEAPKAAAAAPASAPRGDLDESAITKEIVTLVSEKVGYPEDMLELDLDMEADLGIDTVKQAELIGIIRDKYSIPKNENLSLKDYPTLRHVIKFVMDGGTAANAVPESASTSAPSGAARIADAQEAPATPAAEAPKPAPAQTAPSGNLDKAAVTKEIVALVSEKVGYPEDMLELDLDMEADLGIDTVKQAELIGMLREKYGIAKQENLSLKDYPTLNHVIDFVVTAPKDASPTAGETAAAPEADAPPFGTWDLQAYDCPLDGTPRALNKETATVLLAADPEEAEPFAKAVKKAGGDPVVVKAADWDTIEKAEKALGKLLKDKKAGALLDLTTVGIGPAEFDKWTAKGFDKAYRSSTKAVFLAAKVLQKDLDEAGEGAWIASLTRLGGTHAVGAKEFNPIGGAQTGLLKALDREFENAVAKAVDFDLDAKPAFMVEKLLLELSSGEPQREIGYAGEIRSLLRLVPSRDEKLECFKFGHKHVTLITGGGQGLGAELAKKIAKDHKSPLVLIGRTPLAKEATAWARMSEDELAAMKKDMWAKMKEEAKKGKTKKKATPAMLEKEFSKITKAIALQKNIEEMILLGSKVDYFSADMADGPAVTKAVKQALSKFGTVDVVFHAAGLEESKLLGDKKPENFDRVFRAKANGAFHLLKALPPRRGRRWAFFSSVVARFGNVGQIDYAAANDFLAKLAARINADGGSAITYDLTAFAEIGMATRGGIEQFLKSLGVEFMPPETGIELMFDAMKKNDRTHEILVAGALGKLDEEGLIRSSSGEEPAKKSSGAVLAGRSEPAFAATEAKPDAAPAAASAPPKRLGALPEGKPLFDELISTNGSGHITSKEFSLDSDPWLVDHAVGGTPWVAGVMGLELFAETAAKLLGEVPAAFEDVKFQLPIKLLRNRPIKVRAVAKTDGDATNVRIESDFISPQGIKLGAPRTHFTGRVLSDPALGWTGAIDAPTGAATAAVDSAAIYDAYFHGPRFQVLEGITSIAEDGLTAVYKRSPDLWDDNKRSLAYQPMLIEAAFQACGYRDLHFTKKMTLPDSVGKVRVFKTEAPPERLEVRVRFKGTEGDKSVYDAAVVGENGEVWIALEDYRMIRVS
jgi:malonyl CoA-acyl carrier protein transacylase